VFIVEQERIVADRGNIDLVYQTQRSRRLVVKRERIVIRIWLLQPVCQIVAV
jgi:hypothetical protein